MPARVLIRLPNWLGDVVMALPAVGAVREKWPEAHLEVAVLRSLSTLMSAVPGIDGIVPLAAHGWRDRAAVAADLKAIRGRSFDTGILFTNSFASARMLAQAEIPERWGYRADFRSLLLTRAIAKPARRNDADRHHSHYYGRLVESLGCSVRSYAVSISVPDDWRASGNALLAQKGIGPDQRIVGFAPGAAYGAAKQWPPSRVASVIDCCLEEGASCILLGAGGDAIAGEAVMRSLGLDVAVRASCVNLIGQTDLSTLAGLMARCVAFVSNDSGAMHLASAAGIPVVAIFGATDERATAPLGVHSLITGEAWCRPCLRRECPIDHRCMTTIRPEPVFRAVSDLVGGELDARGSPR